MLKSILSISGKPGLYKLISRGKNMLIVESLIPPHKRFPAYSHEMTVSLGEISMYTDGDDVPLHEILTSIKEKENGEAITLDPKKASVDELRAYLTEVLPNYDRDRVYPTDIKKLITWYNVLITNGITDFLPKEEKDEEKEAENTPD